MTPSVGQFHGPNEGLPSGVGGAAELACRLTPRMSVSLPASTVRSGQRSSSARRSRRPSRSTRKLTTVSPRRCVPRPREGRRHTPSPCSFRPDAQHVRRRAYGASLGPVEAVHQGGGRELSRQPRPCPLSAISASAQSCAPMSPPSSTNADAESRVARTAGVRYCGPCSAAPSRGAIWPETAGNPCHGIARYRRPPRGRLLGAVVRRVQAGNPLRVPEPQITLGPQTTGEAIEHSTSLPAHTSSHLLHPGILQHPTGI